MKLETISQDYANDIIYELQKAFWDERGKGGRFRLTTLGRQFYQTKCQPRFASNEIGDMVKTIEAVLRENGIVDSVTFEREDRLLRVRIGGCRHRPVEELMMAKDTKPFSCVPANLIVLAIEEKLNRPAELAEIKLEEGVCRTLLVLFDERPI